MRNVRTRLWGPPHFPRAVRIAEFLAVGESVAVTVLLAQGNGPQEAVVFEVVTEGVEYPSTFGCFVSYTRPSDPIADHIVAVWNLILVALHAKRRHRGK